MMLFCTGRCWILLRDLSTALPCHPRGRGWLKEGRLYKVYKSLQKSGSLRAVTELPSHALIAAGLDPLVNVSEQSTLRGQLGEVSVQDDLHTAGCEANDVAHAEGKSLWRRPPALLS